MTADVIAALDGSQTALVPIPSLLTRLPRAAYVGQQLEKVVLASGLLPSKSASLLPTHSRCALVVAVEPS